MQETEDHLLEDRVAAMGQAQFDPDLKEKIIGVLVSEGAEDLSDSELDRCLERCAAAWLPRMAKMYRDCDFLKATEVFDRCPCELADLFGNCDLHVKCPKKSA